MGKRKPRSRGLVRAAKRRAAADAAHEVAEGNGAPAPTTSWQPRKVTVFERYYREQGLVPQAEWGEFLSSLKRPLPITVRMNSMHHLAQDVEACQAAARDLLYPSGDSSVGMPADQYGTTLCAPKMLAWCRGWQFPCDKASAKYGTSLYMRELQRWLAESSSTGLLTRQEVVSMIPAALLDIRPWHKCLDLCASPGSKTTQLLEGVYCGKTTPGFWDKDAGPEEVAYRGLVVANDFSPARAYLLVRRCAALGQSTESLLIAAHSAQHFPNTKPPLTTKKETQQNGTRYPEGQYDRVLCDVPCSGDGTLRKNPESWASWGPDYGSSLHMLQLLIAIRGAALLKVGGVMAYSTCSFNPVEDEAVVAELLRRCRGAMELVDTGMMLPTLKRRPGIRTWKVMDDEGNCYPTYADSQADSIPEARRRMYQPSMWPSAHQGIGRGCAPLNRCLRFFPHLQDTGGFFVAILKKVGPLPGPPPKGSGHGAQEKTTGCEGALAASGSVAELPTFFKDSHSHRQAHVKVDNECLEMLEVLFGLAGRQWEDLARRLYWRSGGGRHRSIYMVAPGLSRELLDAPGARRLKQVLVGCKIFQWESLHGEHKLRIMPEGVMALLPLATKRVIDVTPSFLTPLLRQVNMAVPISTLTGKGAKKATALRPGPCIWRLVDCNGEDDAIAQIAVPGEVLIGQDETKAAGARYPFVRGREHAPKAAAKMLLRKMQQR